MQIILSERVSISSCFTKAEIWDANGFLEKMENTIKDYQEGLLTYYQALFDKDRGLYNLNKQRNIQIHEGTIKNTNYTFSHDELETWLKTNFKKDKPYGQQYKDPVRKIMAEIKIFYNNYKKSEGFSDSAIEIAKKLIVELKLINDYRNIKFNKVLTTNTKLSSDTYFKDENSLIKPEGAIYQLYYDKEGKEKDNHVWVVLTEDYEDIAVPWRNIDGYFYSVHSALEQQNVLPQESDDMFSIPANLAETNACSFTAIGDEGKNFARHIMKIKALIYYSVSNYGGSPTAHASIHDLFAYVHQDTDIDNVMKRVDEIKNRFGEGESQGRKYTTTNKSLFFIPYRVGNRYVLEEYDDTVDIEFLKEEARTKTKMYRTKLSELLAEYRRGLSAAAETQQMETWLQSEIVKLGYINPETRCDLYLYYPFISASELINGKLNTWDFSYSSENSLASKWPLVSIDETSTNVDSTSTKGEKEEVLQIEPYKPHEIVHTEIDTTIPEYTIVQNVVPTVGYDKDWLLPSTNVIINPSGSTQYKALFPPILEASQPAFVGTATSEYEIFFKLSNYTNFDEIAHVDLKITLQSNNASVVYNELWCDQIIYKKREEINNYGNGLYSVVIKSGHSTENNKMDLIEGHWSNNTYYKVQVRLGTTWSGWENNQQYVLWRNAQAAQGRFSDWSTVMILKSIPAPRVGIINNQEIVNKLTSEDLVSELSTTPLFFGEYNQNNQGGLEFLDTYQYLLYNNEEECLEDSGILQYNGFDNNNDTATVQYRFQRELKSDQEYKVIFKITTVNGFTASAEYRFYSYNFGTEPRWAIHAEIDEENGVIEIYEHYPQKYIDGNKEEKAEKKLENGNYVITRSLAGEKKWELRPWASTVSALSLMTVLQQTERLSLRKKDCCLVTVL